MQKRNLHVLPSFLAGLLNGMLGTGGGVPLWFAANRKENKRAAFATSSAGVLFLSLLSLYSYKNSAVPLNGTSALFLWSSLCGGAFGAYLLPKVPLSAVRLLFAFLLIGSGSFSFLRVIYDVFLA